MLAWIQPAIIGFIEGVTEFIPISSTGHMILAEHFLQFSIDQFPTFAIAIQLGAILAVATVYWTFFKKWLRPRQWLSKESGLITIACLPALALGFLAHDVIKGYLFGPITVAVGLLIGGVLMVGVDRVFAKRGGVTKLENMSYKQALSVGLVQCLSLWPGFSRSASSMMGGIIAGVSYETSANFSFIIALPIMAIAVAYDLSKSWNTLTAANFQNIAIGFIVAFLVATLSIVTFLRLLKRWHLAPFGIYRVALAIVVLWTVFG